MDEGKIEFLRVNRHFRNPMVTGQGTVLSIDRLLLRCYLKGKWGYGEIAPWPGFNTESIDEAIRAIEQSSHRYSTLLETLHDSPGALPCLRAALFSCSHWESISAFSGELSSAGLVTPFHATTLQSKWVEGFTTLKAKITPSTDIAEVRSWLTDLPASAKIRLDANGSLNIEQTHRWLDFIQDEKRVEFLEQPLPVNHEGYLHLPHDKVALDESFLTPGALSWKGVLIVKPLLAGDGLALLKWSQSHRGKRIYSSVFETAIGRQTALWLAAQDSPATVHGFDTLGRFQADRLDRHSGGPKTMGLPHFDWNLFWHEIK